MDLHGGSEETALFNLSKPWKDRGTVDEDGTACSKTSLVVLLPSSCPVMFITLSLEASRSGKGEAVLVPILKRDRDPITAQCE